MTTPLYPTTDQARRYLVLWQIHTARKEKTSAVHWGDKAAAYLPHLPDDVAAELRAEFGFTQEPSLQA